MMADDQRLSSMASDNESSDARSFFGFQSWDCSVANNGYRYSSADKA
jgi:hypothetical protein